MGTCRAACSCFFVVISSVHTFQHPMVLASVVTIHKVQGISSDQEVIDVGDDILDHAQA